MFNEPNHQNNAGTRQTAVWRRWLLAALLLILPVVVNYTPRATLASATSNFTIRIKSQFPTTVTFEGLACPGCTVYLLQDGAPKDNAIALGDATFFLSEVDLDFGPYSFVLYSEDAGGDRSKLFPINLNLVEGTTTIISDIFLSPTITVDPASTQQGNNVVISGNSAPDATIDIDIDGEESLSVQTTAEADGSYSYTLDTSSLDDGAYHAVAEATLGVDTSDQSRQANFEITPIPVDPHICRIADLNCDDRVNLVDFSIAAFWYKKPFNAEFTVIEDERLNGDQKIDLIDFSIMAFYWTG